MSGNHDTFRRTSRFDSLDGLRCLSILPVIWHHSTPRPLEGLLGRGPLGVHLFFAISGFLITTLLLRERDEGGRLGLGAFWARRALRIFPLYYLVLALYVLRTWLLLPDSPQRSHFFQSLPYYATYTGNWLVDYSVGHPVIFGFSWSLATEEQFYLFWPLVLALSRGSLVPFALMAGLLGLDLAAEHGMLAGVLGSSGIPLTVVTSLSAPICLGALLALTLHHAAGYRLAFAVLGRRASAAVALATLTLFVALDDTPLFAIHLAMVALVGAVCIRPDHGLARLLELRPVSHVGAVSYGLYLFHVSAITLTKTLWPAAGAFAIFLASTLISLGMANVSYRWFERPFLGLRERFRGGRTAAAGPGPASSGQGQYAAS